MQWDQVPSEHLAGGSDVDPSLLALDQVLAKYNPPAQSTIERYKGGIVGFSSPHPLSPANSSVEDEAGNGVRKMPSASSSYLAHYHARPSPSTSHSSASHQDPLGHILAHLPIYVARAKVHLYPPKHGFDFLS